MSYIKNNKEFILGVVAYGNKPDMSNKIAANIIAEYEQMESCLGYQMKYLI